MLMLHPDTSQCVGIHLRKSDKLDDHNKFYGTKSVPMLPDNATGFTHSATQYGITTYNQCLSKCTCLAF